MRVFEIAEVMAHARGLLKRDPLLADLWVRGEIASVTYARSGHVYFCLRDGSNQLDCVMFKRAAQYLSTRLEPGQIYDSNAYAIASMVRECGGVPRLLGIAGDTVEALTEKLQAGLDADMLVTSAGVSRGDYDMVKDVLAKEGEVALWTVRMRPGKPLAFGSFPSGGRRVPHLGLPGNPVSSMVSFELFGRPAIYTMLGRADWERPRVRAIADERIDNADGRRVYARAILEQRGGRWHAALTGPQGSGILTSMALANALAIVPEDVAAVQPGDEVDAILLD